MKRSIYTIVVFSVVAFALHLLWESFHVSLYGGYENLSTYVPIAIWASVGDVLYALVAISLVSLFKGGVNWVTRAWWKEYTGLALMGLSIAVFVEYKAFVFDRWFYLDTMPIIPFLEVGLSPVLQMTLLLPISVFVTGYIVRYQ